MMINHSDLTAALKQHFGFDTFKGNQEAIIQSLLNGHNTFVLMPTGGGKSLCYQLPALVCPGTAIVISPLIALMKNQVDAMRNFSEEDGVAHFLNSSLNKSAIDKVKSDIVSGLTRLLYVAPESLTKEDNIEFLKTIPISFYAVDEAHCISEWGHDFRPEYRRIRPIINEIGNHPVIALTATATPKVQHDIQKSLGILDANLFKSSFNRKNLYYEIRPKTANTDKDIIKFIKSMPGKSGIVYCLSRKKVEEFAEMLRVNDIRALPYHAGMDSVTRAANQDAFLYEEVDVIVATIAFGMGIDKPDVRFVIHYDMPKSLEGYYQETGRAGRDGGEGICITFYSAKDLQKMEKFIQNKPLVEQEIGKQLLAETAGYAESSVCRRKTLLHYFGEEYTEENCGNCDNCLHPRAKVDATDALLNILETVAIVKDRKPEYIIDLLRGLSTAEVKSYHHDEIETFGCSKDDKRFLNAVIRQAVIAGYLERDIERFGLLHITPKGEEFLSSPSKFLIVEDHDFKDFDSQAYSGSGAGGAVDPVLFSILKDLCKKVARRLNLPPYVVFQEPSLEAMATTFPITIDELANISGVGTGKARRFGKDFVDLIAKYVDENEIERPEDLKVKSVANKSKLKIALIHAIDRMVPLDEIAASRNLSMPELIDELEGILNSGTKININYYVNDLIDEDLQADIFDFFKESETGDLSQAIKEFGDDCTEDELRLMHIKFIAEMGF